MQLRIHDDPASFLADAGGFLRAADAENSIIATPVSRMIAAPDPDDADAYLACAVDRGSVIAAALHSSGASLSRELLESGKRAIFLTTDLANPTSNSIYRKIGYRPVADHFHFDFQAVPAADSA